MKNPAENNKRVAQKHVVPLFPYDSYHCWLPFIRQGACWQNLGIDDYGIYNVVGGVGFNVLFPEQLHVYRYTAFSYNSSLVEVIRTN